MHTNSPISSPTLRANNLSTDQLRAKDPNSSPENIESWERAIFFDPRLKEVERRKQSGRWRVAVLLALLLGPLAAGASLANEQTSVSENETETSSAQTLSEWLLSILTIDNEDDGAQNSLKSSENEDPREGDPK